MLARGIIFDFNGVIADDEALHFQAFSAILAGYGIPLTREQYNAEFLGLTDQESFRRSFERAGKPTDKRMVTFGVEQKADMYEDLARRELTLINGAREFIEAATAARIAVGIGSSALRREVEFVLQMTGLRDHFETIVSGEEVERCKPDPQTFERARQRLRLTCDECVVIEDSPAGIAAARAGGFRCAGITSSVPAEALKDANLIWTDFSGHFPADLPWANA